MAAGWGIQIFLLLGLTGSSMPNDLLSLIDPEAYFRARQVPVTVGKMLQLAGKQPTDAKSEVARLLAIRMLGDEPEEVQKEKEAIVKILNPIAAGKSAKGDHGFAQVYARRTLDRLGIKPTAGGQDAAEQKLIDLFAWFPDKVTFGMAGKQGSSALSEGKSNPLRDFLAANMPPREMEEMYKFAEAIGNLRIDGLAFGYASDPKAPRKAHIYFRIHGAGDHQRLLEFLRKNLASPPFPNLTVKEEKGPGGERISLINLGQAMGPVMALVGDSDFLVAGSEDNQANQMDVMEEILKTRSGAKPNALKGPLAAALKKVSPEAVGLVLGELPAEFRQMFMFFGGPIQTLPEQINMEVKPTAKGTDFRFQGKFVNAGQAKLFAEGVATLRKQGLEALKTPPPLPPGAKIPPRAFELMRTALEDLKMEAKGDSVAGGTQVSRELINALPALMGGAGMMRGVEMPMPTAPVPLAKPEQKKDSK